MSWIQKLKKEFSGDVSTNQKILQENSRDASIFEVKPSVVVFPKTYDQVKSLVTFVNRKDISATLTGRAAGTDMTGGPLTESIVVNFKHLNKIKKLNIKNAVVQPGLYYRDLEKQMNKIKVFFPSYPASKSICALGGMIANNAGSEKTLNYGQTVDHVNKLKVVLADGKLYEFGRLNKTQLKAKMKLKNFEGKVYRDMYKLCEDNYNLIKKAKPNVHKNSCGYLLWRVWDREYFDLSKIFVGSQGTLGLWVEGNVNVVKKHKYTRLVTVYLKDLKKMTEVVNIVLKYKPESLESFDKNTLMLGLRFMPEIAKKVKKNSFSFLWGFRREGILTLTKGLPVFIVLVELTGDTKKEVTEKAEELSKELNKKNISNLVMRSEEEGEKYWIMRRESFALLRSKVKDKQATPFVDDFCVKPEYLGKFLPKLYALLKRYDIKPTLAGHAGDGNFHIIPLMDLKDENVRKKIPIVLDKFTDLVIKYNGTITAEHNDGMIRTPFVEKQYGRKVVKLFEKVKDIFDPNDIFNPGKKVHGDLEYAMSHIKNDN